MCACDTKQAQGFPAHHNKAQPLDRAMRDQSMSTTTPGPAVPQDRVLLSTTRSPCRGKQSQPQVALLGLSPPQSPLGHYKSFPLTGSSEELVLQFGTAHPWWGEGHFQSCPPHQHTLGAHSTSVNARTAPAGLDLHIRRDNIPSERKMPSRGADVGRGGHRLFMVRGVRGRETLLLLGRCGVWVWGCKRDAGLRCRRWEGGAERGYRLCKILQGLW